MAIRTAAASARCRRPGAWRARHRLRGVPATPAMRAAAPTASAVPVQHARVYWTVAQMVTHHASTAAICGRATCSGAAPSPARSDRIGCLLEMTFGGRDTITLRNGETRRYLDDGDEVIFRAHCQGAGAGRSASANAAGGLWQRDGQWASFRSIHPPLAPTDHRPLVGWVERSDTPIPRYPAGSLGRNHGPRGPTFCRASRSSSSSPMRCMSRSDHTTNTVMPASRARSAAPPDASIHLRIDQRVRHHDISSVPRSCGIGDESISIQICPSSRENQGTRGRCGSA